MARATIECKDENALLDILLKLGDLVRAGVVYILRIKHRLSELFDAVEAG